MDVSTTLSQSQLAYLSTQRLGRLATVRADGSPQCNPVGFTYNAELGTIDIAGYNMGASLKFRNLKTNDRVAFVIDDIASVDPWTVRFVEIRGTAEALAGQPSSQPGMSGEIIRIHPARVIAYGIDADADA
jgi:pyridoxamine 5'-phosphate oxidase family protein